jgi:hypothetical protein
MTLIEIKKNISSNQIISSFYLFSEILFSIFIYRKFLARVSFLEASKIQV